MAFDDRFSGDSFDYSSFGAGVPAPAPVADVPPVNNFTPDPLYAPAVNPVAAPVEPAPVVNPVAPAPVIPAEAGISVAGDSGSVAQPGMTEDPALSAGPAQSPEPVLAGSDPQSPTPPVDQPLQENAETPAAPELDKKGKPVKVKPEKLKQVTSSGKSVWAVRIGQVVSTVVLILAIGAGAFVLAAQNQDFGLLGWHEYRVLSGSMAPDIPIHSVVFVQETAPQDIKVGDVITFMQKDQRSVTHKVINILPNYQGSGEIGFRTKGTHNPNADKDVTIGSNVVGVVRLHVAEVGYYFDYVANNILIVFVIYALLVAAFTLFAKANKDRKKALKIAQLKAAGVYGGAPQPAPYGAMPGYPAPGYPGAPAYPGAYPGYPAPAGYPAQPGYPAPAAPAAAPAPAGFPAPAPVAAPAAPAAAPVDPAAGQFTPEQMAQMMQMMQMMQGGQAPATAPAVAAPGVAPAAPFAPPAGPAV